jgi:D-arabinose 1-dehydrogenase-like Zn-dependent alcohol dehydrogenase
MNTTKTRAYAANSATSLLASSTIPRREPTPREVQIEILFCGICHSDLHHARNEWSSLSQTVYPCVPGHEIVGRVTKVGADVAKFKPGDLAAVRFRLTCTSVQLHTCPARRFLESPFECISCSERIKSRIKQSIPTEWFIAAGE